MSYQLELRHLKYFIAVSEEHHFRKAAEKLFISQPGLSRQIKKLEDELGVTLIKRDNRNVQLTAAGTYLAQEAKKWMRTISEGLERVQLIDSGVEGTLKLGYVGSAMQGVIPEMLNSLLKQTPSIKFTLTEMNNSSQVEALLDGSIDVGFMRTSETPLKLKTKPVLSEPFCLVVPEQHSISTSNFISLNQVKDEAFILFEKAYSPTYYSEVMSLFNDAGFSPKISHSSVHALTIYKMVESGYGMAIIPKSLIGGFNMKIKFIDLSNLPQRSTLYMAWNSENLNPILNHVFNNFEA